MAILTLEWWLNDDVTGGMVKYLRSAPSEANGSDDAEVPDQWTLELLNAATERKASCE